MIEDKFNEYVECTHKYFEGCEGCSYFKLEDHLHLCYYPVALTFKGITTPLDELLQYPEEPRILKKWFRLFKYPFPTVPLTPYTYPLTQAGILALHPGGHISPYTTPELPVAGGIKTSKVEV